MRPCFLALLLAGCSYELESPAPSVGSVDPGLVCNDQLSTTVTLFGSNLTPLPAGVVSGEASLILPKVWLTRRQGLDGADAAADEVSVDASVLWRDDGTMSFVVDPALALGEGVFDVSVENADGRTATAESAIAAVPPPVAESFVPGLVCVAQAPQEAVLTGSGFLEIDGAPPVVWVGDLALTPDALVDCFDVGGPVAARSCSELALTLPQGGLSDGIYDVTVLNPETAQCESTEPVQVQIVPPPTLDAVEPALTCTAQEGQAFTLFGSDFLVLADGTLPTVTIGDFSIPADAASGCVPLSGPEGGESCAELTVFVEAGDLETGLLDVTVQNPGAGACVSTEAVQVEVIAPPVVASIDPTGTCTDAVGDVILEITGAGFLTTGADVPTVTIGGVALSPVTASGCDTPLLGSVPGDLCDTLTVTIPDGTFPDAVADHALVVTNPEPAACSSEEPVSWGVTAPPIITGIEPPQVCDDGSGLNSFTVRGESFSETSEVQIDGISATTTFIDDTELEALLPAGLGIGLHDVTVVNPGGCSDTAPASLDVVGMPLVFFVDPPTTYQGVDLLATAFVSGINNDVLDVWLENAADGTVVPVTWEPWDAAQPSLVQFTVPAGLPEGSYHLSLTDGASCDPVLLDAIFVEADVAIDLVAVEPPFGWTNDVTAVEITGTGSPALVDLPRVYFSPVGGTLATKLSAVTWQSDTLLDAVVPEGLPVGSYDVLVVNPDGTIGYLPGGFDVVIDPPPIVDAVAPPSLPSSADTAVLVQGANFRSPTVDLDCIDPTTEVPFAVAGLVINSFTATSIDVVVPASSDPGLSGGAVCAVVVTNDDGTTATFAAISVTNPSQNLYPWQAGAPMTTPRRGLAVEAGRATRTARYLYAIGGDDGFGTVWDSIERAKVDTFGDLGAWEQLPIRLPAPTTLAGSAQLGRFVYVVGGTDGLTPTADVWRAQILDPLEAPVIDPNLAVTLDPVGLAEGTYIYRVAALFDMAYDDNPAGESLPSDPFVVRLPEVSPDNLQLTLAWDAVPDAIGYRVYRSDSGSGGEAWVADVLGATTFVDTGIATDPAVGPLPAGALGEWAALPSLPVAVEAPGVAIATDPVDPAKAYLYVAGGLDTAGITRDDIAYLALTLVDEHDHEAGAAWATSGFTLGAPRSELQAVTVTSELHSRIAAGDSWIYWLQGDDGGGATSTNDAMRVGAGGDFVEAHDVSGSSRAGHGAAHASNMLYVFGGGNGSPTSSGDSAEICEPGLPACAGGPPDPPDVTNWNGLGLSMSESRYLLGSTQESSVIFAVGGETGGGATTSVDFTNY